uniref:Putative secreted protein n=1 Tax=Rhipicephalus microplus TaxID=6941 RepID=A0A6G5A224_RHIMP
MLTVAHVTTVSDLTLILNILQTLKHLATVNGQGIPKALTVLGLTVFSDQDFNSAATTITQEAKPDIIISYGHLIFERHTYDHCKILGPTNMKLGQSPPSYAYDLRHTHETAFKLSRVNFNSVIYISVSLRGFSFATSTCVKAM